MGTITSTLSSISSKDEISQNELNSLIDRKEWYIIQKLIKKYGRDGMIIKDTLKGRIPLHKACIKDDVPTFLLDELLLLYPEGTIERDKDGLLPLHYAVQNQTVNLEFIKKLVAIDKPSVREFDVTGRLPVHLACYHRLDIKIIQYLVEEYPDSVSRRTQTGRLPLHFAIEGKCSIEIIKFLIQQFPNGVNEVASGKLPIHYACEHGNGIDVLKLIHELDEGSSKRKSLELMLPIHYLTAHKANIEKVAMFMNLYPDGLTDKDVHGRLPLHYALNHVNNSDVILMLLEKEPETSSIRSRGGHLPLHLAIEKHQSTEVILDILKKFPPAAAENDMMTVRPVKKAIKNKLDSAVVIALLQEYPEAASEIDEYDRIPLHYAVSSNMSLEVIQTLLKMCPQGASIPDTYSQLPLHLTVKRLSPTDIIDVIIKAYPPSVITPDKYDMTPLHHALEVDCPVEMIRQLLLADKRCAEFRMDGKLPIHLALESKKSYDIIKVILETYPKCASEIDLKFGMLPIHWAIRRKLPLPTILLIEQAYPAIKSAFIQDYDGYLPIHYAIKFDSPVEIVRILLKENPDVVFEKDLPVFYKHYDKPGKPLKTKGTIDKENLSITEWDRDDISEISLYNEWNDDISSTSSRRGHHINIQPQYESQMLGRMLIHYAAEDANVSFETLAELLDLTMPFDKITGAPVTDHSFTWTYVLAKTQDVYFKAVEIVLDRCNNNMKILQLMNDAPDEQGRKAVDIATLRCQKAILKRMYYFGRYELKVGPFEHVSNNSTVRLAYDHEDNKRLVALKFVRDRVHFDREISRRSQVDINEDFAIGLIRFHDSDSDPNYLDECTLKGFNEYPYLLVMDAAERNFYSIMVHEHFTGGKDWEVIKSYTRQILFAIKYFHDKGVIHGDIKPLNIMRFKGTLKLIDFGASVSFAKKEFAGGFKSSSAYLPPEMTVPPKKLQTDPLSNLEGNESAVNEEKKDIIPTSVDFSDGITMAPTGKYRLGKNGLPVIGDGSVELVPAHPSIDIWAFGVLFYYLCTGESLFLSNLDDEIDDQQKVLLSIWSDEIKQPKLLKIANPFCRNLIDQILSKTISRRPSCDYILSHPFFVGWKSQSLVGRFPGMPAKYDICLVYRRHGKRNAWKGTNEDNESDWRSIKANDNNTSTCPNDDEIVDKFREQLETSGLKVCDCYSDDENAKFTEGDGLNMIHSKMVLVILSRYSINNDNLSFDDFVPHAKYDHMLFQLHLALELRAGHLFDKDIHVMLVGDFKQIERKVAIPDTDMISSPIMSPKVSVPIPSKDVSPGVKKGDKKKKKEAVKEVVKEVKYDIFIDDIYESYYAALDDGVSLGRYGGSHPTKLPPVSVLSVKSRVVELLLRVGLGNLNEENNTVLNIISQVIQCPSFEVKGLKDVIWKEALKWILEVRYGYDLQVKDNKNERTFVQGSTIDQSANLALIQLLQEKLYLKQYEIDNLEKEVKSYNDQIQAQFEVNKMLKSNLNMHPSSHPNLC